MNLMTNNHAVILPLPAAAFRMAKTREDRRLRQDPTIAVEWNRPTSKRWKVSFRAPRCFWSAFVPMDETAGEVPTVVERAREAYASHFATQGQGPKMKHAVPTVGWRVTREPAVKLSATPKHVQNLQFGVSGRDKRTSSKPRGPKNPLAARRRHGKSEYAEIH